MPNAADGGSVVYGAGMVAGAAPMVLDTFVVIQNAVDENSSYGTGSQIIAAAGAAQAVTSMPPILNASLGSNGKLYLPTAKTTTGWGGNGSVTTVKIAGGVVMAGVVIAGAALVWDWINVFTTGDVSATKAGVNTGFTGLGLVGGPAGAATAAGYSLIDNYYPGGWLGNGSNQPYNGAGALLDYGTTVEKNKKIVPDWRPRDPGSI
jgi:hypothetical protein